MKDSRRIQSAVDKGHGDSGFKARAMSAAAKNKQQ